MKIKVLSDFYQYSDLIKILISRDVKLKYIRSILGYIWSILNPLMFMAVMTIVFSHLFSSNISNFPVYLFMAQLLNELLSNGTTLLFVSHSTAQIKRLCKNVIWLDHGMVKMIGDSKTICDAYSKL